MDKQNKLSPSNLTDIQEAFARYKAQGFSNIDAVRLSSPNSQYNDTSASTRGSQLLANQKVSDRIEEIKLYIEEQAQMNVAFTFEHSTGILIKIIRDMEAEIKQDQRYTKWKAEIIITCVQELNRMHRYSSGKALEDGGDSPIIFINEENLHE